MSNETNILAGIRRRNETISSEVYQIAAAANHPLGWSFTLPDKMGFAATALAVVGASNRRADGWHTARKWDDHTLTKMELVELRRTPSARLASPRIERTLALAFSSQKLLSPGL
jgi:hypothetical protein